MHLWLVNDDVSPPVYVHMPAVLDTGCQEELLIPLRDAKKLQLAEDTLISGQQNVAAHNSTPVLTYRPVRVLVPMLNERDGQIAFYMPGWLKCTSFGKVALPDRARSPSAVAAADLHVEEAGAQAIAMVGDRSGAWVQTSPTKHAWHDLHQEHAVLGWKAMDVLSLYFDKEHGAFRTVKMRTIRRGDDTF